MKSSNIIGKLPFPLGDMPAVVKDRWLYIFGGGSGEEIKDDILRVNSKGQTEIIGKIPVAVRGHQAVIMGDSIYLLGGFLGATINKVFRLNLENGTADPVAPMPNDTAWFTAVAVGHKIVVVGGFSVTDGYWQHMAVYDTTKDLWQKIDGAFPAHIFKNQRLGSNVAVALGETVFSFGGADVFDPENMRANALATSGSFNLETKTWESIPAKIEPREGLVSALSGHVVFLVGGMGEGTEKPSTTIERVDLKTGDTERYAILQIPRIAPAVGILDGTLVITGGVTRPVFEMTDQIEAVTVN